MDTHDERTKLAPTIETHSEDRNLTAVINPVAFIRRAQQTESAQCPGSVPLSK
jgi:hypothetical protein